VVGTYLTRIEPYHIKVQKPGGRIITTQLYFPDDPLNRRDGLFDPRLLMRITDTAGGQFGRFDFVV
jgi:protocatechuate 3,4-dioxygenase beta subunit